MKLVLGLFLTLMFVLPKVQAYTLDDQTGAVQDVVLGCLADNLNAATGRPGHVAYMIDVTLALGDVRAVPNTHPEAVYMRLQESCINPRLAKLGFRTASFRLEDYAKMASDQSKVMLAGFLSDYAVRAYCSDAEIKKIEDTKLSNGEVKKSACNIESADELVQEYDSLCAKDPAICNN